MRDTIDMAREANLAKYGDGLREGVFAFIDALKAFEALVRADERSVEREVIIDLVAMYGGPVDLEAAIKQALANEALDKMAENARELGLDYEPAPVQEPVAWGVHDQIALNKAIANHSIPAAPYVAPQLVQEPVAWMHVQGIHEEPSLFQLDEGEFKRGWEQYPLYTTPPAQPAPVLYQLPDDLYDSKDWKVGSYAERVEWLHTMYEAKKRELEYCLDAAPVQEPKKFDPNDSFERDEAARNIVREFMRNH